MALTTGQNIESRNATVIDPEIVDAQTMFPGGLAAIGRGDAAIVANRGRAQPYANTADFLPAGFQQQQETLGATSDTPIPRANINTQDFILERVAVAGLAGDVTDMLKSVFFTDDFTLTLTEPVGPSMIVGVVISPIDATQADVLIFGMISLMLQAFGGGGGRRTELIGLVSGVSGGGYTAAAAYEASDRAKITDVFGVVVEPLITAVADLDLNLEINAVALTGGVVEWLIADVAGTRKTGTLVTALNVYHKTDDIGFRVVENSASTGGLMTLWAETIREPGQ